jgi:hypothetical protein
MTELTPSEDDLYENPAQLALVSTLLSPQEREELAGEVPLAPHLQHHLAGDEHYPVLEALATNPSLVPEVQMRLAADVDFEHEFLAGNRSLVEEVQRVLANHERVPVRESLASNPSVTKEVQLLLAQDEEYGVRFSLAFSATTSLEVYRLLALDPEQMVRRVLTENPAAVLDATYPLAFLESSERGLAVVSGTLARVGADSEAFSALRVGWSGSLAELLDVAEEFRASS